MRYHVLAIDYDGTLATHGSVPDGPRQALEDLRAAGRKLLLVTGRQLPDLALVFPHLSLFDRVVAENGGVLLNPATREERALAPAPPEELIQFLRERNIPISTGRVILASWEPHEKSIVEAIHELGLEYHIIFNKGAVMVLPSGINKATGLRQALLELGYSNHNVVGAGDAENDHAFLNLCECSVAVSNALDSLKKRVDWITQGSHGAGITEIIEGMVRSDLSDVPRTSRHDVLLGVAAGGTPLALEPYGHNVLLCGTSGGGKSTLAMGFLERLSEAGYQFCIIDPEGDYGTFDNTTTLGEPNHAPEIEAVVEVLKKPNENLVINLMAVPLKDRPAFFERLFVRISEVRARFGRPHWLVIDEAHHLFPSSRPLRVAPDALQGLFVVTVHPDHVAKEILMSTDTLLSLGETAAGGLRAYCQTTGSPVPPLDFEPLRPGEAWAWFRTAGAPPARFTVEPPRTQKRRHRRKYAEGELPADQSFYFRGPEQKLNLRVQNLQMFIQLAEGIDDDTWLYHLRRGDYSDWFQREIKDGELADETASIEKNGALTPSESRGRVIHAIQSRYTAPV